MIALHSLRPVCPGQPTAAVRSDASGCAPSGASLFFARAKKSKQKKHAPTFGSSLRSDFPRSGAASGVVTMGRPCPIAPRSASMPRAPLRNASTRPLNGEFPRPTQFCSPLAFRKLRVIADLGGSVAMGPVSRVSGIGAQRVEPQGCGERRRGPWMALVRRPSERRWSERTPSAQRSGPDVGCAFSLVTFSLHRAAIRKQRESNSPCKAKPVAAGNKKVTFERCGLSYGREGHACA